MTAALPNIALGPRLMEYRIKRQWPAMVGRAVAARTEPTRLIKDTLYCVVNSSAWMTELNYQKPLIINKINDYLGKEAVKAVVFRPGVVTRRTPPSKKNPPARGTLETGFIEETASKIGDESLRGLVKRVMKKYPY